MVVQDTNAVSMAQWAEEKLVGMEISPCGGCLKVLTSTPCLWVWGGGGGSYSVG